MFYISYWRSWENLNDKDIVMPAHAYAWRTHYAILRRLEISQVSNNKNRHNVSLNLPTMYDVPPSPGLTSAANLRISKIKNDKLTFFFLKKWFLNSRSKFAEVTGTRKKKKKSKLFCTQSSRFYVTLTLSKLLSLGNVRKKASSFALHCSRFVRNSGFAEVTPSRHKK